MKRIMNNVLVITALFVVINLTGCKNEIESPAINFKVYTADANGNVIKEVSPGGELTVSPGQKVYFKYNGSKDDKVSVWPGDRSLEPGDSTSFDYDAFVKSGGDVRKYHGFALNQGTGSSDFSYIFKAPGSFKTYVLASAIGNWGDDKASSSQYVNIIAIDSESLFTTFKSFSVKKLGRNIPVTNVYEAEVSGNNLLVKVPGSSDVTAVIAQFEVEKGSVVKVNNSVQTSALTENDFTNPLVYSITGPNGDSKTYTVTLQKDAKKTEAVLFTYELPDINAKATIDQAAGTINFLLPYATDTTLAYKTAFTKSDMATVKKGSQTLTSGQASIKYNKPLKINVIAEDVAFSKSYSLKVEYGIGISAASLPGLMPSPAASFDYINNSILFNVLKGTAITAMPINLTTFPYSATIKIINENGQSINKDFVSGVSLINFSKPISLEISDSRLGTLVYTISVKELE